MPDHGARIQHWYAKHTGWRAWEDLSNSELRKWMRWFRHHAGVLRGGGLHNIPPTVAMVVNIPLEQVLPALQQLRRSLAALRTWIKGEQTLQCAVALQRHAEHDFLEDHSAKTRLVALCGAMVEREFRELGNVVFTYTESPVESDLHVQRWKAATWWRLASVRIESGTGGPPGLPALALGKTLATAWDGGHFFPPGPKLTKAAMMRELRGGGKRGKRSKGPKLWLFYMDDSAPHPHQVKIHAASVPETLPWTSHTSRLQEPGEKLARFVGSYVTGPGPHLVLVPTWTPGERVELSPTCTAVGYKPTTSVLQHVEPWVACEDTATMYECIRAGKQLVFRSSPSTRAAWGEYMRHLLGASDKDTYERMLGDLTPAKLRQFGKTHLADYTPAFHALLTEQLGKSEQEVVWAE